MTTAALAKRERVSARPPVAPLQLNAMETVADHTAEMALIGVILTVPELYEQVSEMVQPGDFQVLLRAYAWHAMQDIAARGESIDLNTVAAQMGTYSHVTASQDELILQLAAMMDQGNAAALLNYARRVRAAAVAMRVLYATANIQTMIINEPKLRIDTPALVDRINEMMFRATEQTPEHDRSIAATLGKIADGIEARMNDEVQQTVATGYQYIDEGELGGLVRGEIMMLAGGAGMGKTTWALGIVDNVSKRGVRGAVFSLEMTREEIITALMSMNTGIPRAVMGRKKLTGNQYTEFLEAGKAVSAYPVEIVDKREHPTLTPNQLRATLRRLRAGGEVHYAVIDGLWLMDMDQQVGADGRLLPKPDRAREVHFILRELSDIATQFDIPILLIHQYSREARMRQDKRPQRTDLAESSSCERTVQIILAMHRASYHDMDAGTNNTEVYVLKDRNGGLSETPYQFRWVAGRDKYENVG